VQQADIGRLCGRLTPANFMLGEPFGGGIGRLTVEVAVACATQQIYG
jgi:hypothetical protein